ncbi:MAG: acyl-CoA dehydrogenase [Rhodospirillaceae bacterium]|jgi:acyl-CoA dehydrogenase|nr:acyl-CoA dehydrogenase [Rhodospirillaceae bacterium]
MALDTETFNILLETVERFVAERLVPLEAQVASEDQVPADVIAEMKELGLFGLTIPEEYGGLGLTMTEEIEVAIRLGGTTPAFRSIFGTNIGIGSQGIVMDGTPQQKAHYLPKLASGEMISSFALTEPEAGSDAGSLKTSARLDGDHYVLNGTKRFITNSPSADIFTLMARTDPDTPGAKGISAFIVERNSPGLSVGSPDKKMGQQGAKTADVILEDCRVPAANIIGGVAGVGFKTAMKVLDRGRLHISAVSVGIAERLIKECVNYASERKQFGKAIAEFQLIQAMLADSKAESYAARTMVFDAAKKKEAGENITLEAACCKMFATEMVGKVADRAVQIFGGAGYLSEYPIERLYRDVRLFRIYEGTTQIQQLIIARELLKEAE